MIGEVVMDVSSAEIVRAIEFYLNREVFYAGQGMRNKNMVAVTEVRQRSNGRFVIVFNSEPEPEWPTEIETVETTNERTS